MAEVEEEEEMKNVVVRTRIYQIIKGVGSEALDEGKLQVSKALFAALDKKVMEIVLEACGRTIGNKRKTVYPRDL